MCKKPFLIGSAAKNLPDVDDIARRIKFFFVIKGVGIWGWGGVRRLGFCRGLNNVSKCNLFPPFLTNLALSFNYPLSTRKYVDLLTSFNLRMLTSTFRYGWSWKLAYTSMVILTVLISKIILQYKWKELKLEIKNKIKAKQYLPNMKQKLLENNSLKKLTQLWILKIQKRLQGLKIHQNVAIPTIKMMTQRTVRAVIVCPTATKFSIKNVYRTQN